MRTLRVETRGARRLLVERTSPRDFARIREKDFLNRERDICPRLHERAYELLAGRATSILPLFVHRSLGPYKD